MIDVDLKILCPRCLIYRRIIFCHSTSKI